MQSIPPIGTNTNKRKKQKLINELSIVHVAVEVSLTGGISVQILFILLQNANIFPKKNPLLFFTLKPKKKKKLFIDNCKNRKKTVYHLYSFVFYHLFLTSL